jgi:hypothetical protein
MLKCMLQDAFTEGTVRDNQTIERLGAQKHERAIGELELKRRKLENKAMDKQHQREQHEFRMLQMQLMMTQNQQTAPQSQPQLALDSFGLISDLLPPPPSGSSSSHSTPFSI